MVVLTIMLLAFGCFIFLMVRKGSHLNAEQVVMNYLEAIVNGRTDEAYHFLSSQDRTQQTLAEYRAHRSLGHGLIANMIARRISFTVETTEKSANAATVLATVTAPDFKMIMNDVLHGMGGNNIPEQNLEAFIFVCQNISHYLEKYRQHPMPMKVCRESYSLIREKGKWKIALS
ncbi:MAG: hypothetical protein CSYNP_00279 [Syntrophus sp. SKADARSKE-3]|nr:hypothetical protein [Syntrophus sp. SKADARSKE-3]